MDNQNQTTGGTAPEEKQATEGKTFTQEEVNSIVSERLKRERDKMGKEQEEKLNEREKAIAARELRMTATEQLNAAGLPKTLVDAINCSDEETMMKSIDILSKAFQSQGNVSNVKPDKVMYTPRGPMHVAVPDFRGAMGI